MPAAWKRTAETINTHCLRITTDALMNEVTNPEQGSSLLLGGLFPPT
jgi:hypothetical protein